MVNFLLKQKIKCCNALSGYPNLKEYCKYLEISESFLSLIINNKKQCSAKTAKKLIEKTKCFGRYAVTAEDLYLSMCEDNKYSNNQNSKVKNNKDTVSTACEDNGDIVCNTSA